MTETERLAILYGDPAFAPPERVPLRAGPLSLVYTADGDLRYIKWGEHEIMRRLYAAVRDDNWGTAPAAITETERTIGEDGFRIAYEAQYTDAAKNIDFLARVTLTGDANGTITFDFDGEARSTFSRNRIGICALHPAQDCKGKPCVVQHTDGQEEKGAFPDLIAPHQPFFDIAAIMHEVAPGVSAMVVFEGDVFEMEDQRNWLDASFKTYSTPLALPYPVEVPAGTCIRQTVTLTMNGENAAVSPYQETVQCNIGGRLLAWIPEIGLCFPSEKELSAVNVVSDRVRALGLHHLRIELDAANPSLMEHLVRARKTSAEVGLGVVAALQNAEKLAADIPNDILNGVSWLLMDPLPAGVEKMEALLPPEKAVFFGGTASNFTELNRNRFSFYLDGLVYGGNPQVHAFDALSIMETPPIVADTLRSATRLRGDSPQSPLLHLGPLTFYGPYQTADPRQKSLFAAAWYAAAIIHAVRGGAVAIDLCEIVGARGLMAEDGAPYPAYYAVQALCRMSSARQIVATQESEPDQISCLAYTKPEGGDVAVLVNRTPATLNVTVRAIAKTASVRLLDETTAEKGFGKPRLAVVTGGEITLTLLPYAIAEVHLIFGGIVNG